MNTMRQSASSKSIHRKFSSTRAESLCPFDIPREGYHAQRTRWLVLAWLGILVCPSGFGETYTITDLGTLPSYYSEAHGLNAFGAVVGEFEPTNSIYQHAFYYHDGANVDIGSIGPNNIYAIAYAINSSNQIVGESSPFDPNVSIRAFTY